MSSLEGKNNAPSIRWCDDHVEWSGLSLSFLFDHKDKFSVQAHALGHEVKYVRLVKKTIGCKSRWFVQLVLKGTAKIKRENQIGTGTVGLDIGPSTGAIVGDTDARLVEFCPKVGIPYKQTRVVQRKMDRSLRATNPDNYNENGTIKSGKKQRVFSAQYRVLKLCWQSSSGSSLQRENDLMESLPMRFLSSGLKSKPRNFRTKLFKEHLAKAYQDALRVCLW
jgi:putative transposase